MPLPRLIAILRPTIYVILAAGVLLGVGRLFFWAPTPEPEIVASGSTPGDLAHLDLHRVRLPSPDLSPREVVEIQLAGLQDAKADGVGILQCFCFASPGNRLTTGPLERFGQMVRQAPFDCLGKPHAVLIGRPEYRQRVARLLVTVVDTNGRVCGFTFILSKQKASPVRDCWMTDAVLPALPPQDRPEPPPEQPALAPPSSV